MKTIPLTQGKVALVDDADYGAVSQFKWYAAKMGRRFYAARALPRAGGKQVIQLLHQFLVPGTSGVDHRDGDGLNNQRFNLRPATHRQNGQGFRHKAAGTTSRFRGVYWNKRKKKWHARLKRNGNPAHLGYFSDETKAARAYDEAARKYFGDFASPNFPL